VSVTVFSGVRPRSGSSGHWLVAMRLRAHVTFLAGLLRRYRLFGALWMSGWAAAGLWFALATPPLFEAETVIVTREEPSPLYAYNTSPPRNFDNRAMHRVHLTTILRENEVIRRALASLDPADVRRLAGPQRDAGEDRVLDHVRRKLVRVRPMRDSPAILVYVRAADSALTHRFSTALLGSATVVVRHALRETSARRVLALQQVLRRNADPSLESGLLASIAAETEKSLLMGGNALQVLSGPVVSEKRVVPKRKLILSLSLTLGFSLLMVILLVGDRAARTRFLSPPGETAEPEARPPGPVSPLRHAAAILAMFMVLYVISFKIAPSLTTTRMAFVALSVLFFLTQGAAPLLRFIEKHFVVFLLYAFVLAHAGAGYVLGVRESLQLSRVVEFGYVGLFIPFLFLGITGYDWRRFHKCVMVAVLAQSVMHVISFLSAGFRHFVDTHLSRLGNYDLTYAIVPPGFSNGAAATFSVVQALGLISTLITLRHARSLRMAFLCAVAATLMLVSAGVAGRTGMLVALMMMGVFAWRSGMGVRLAVASALGVIVTLFVVFIDDIKVLVSLFGDDLDWQLNSILKRSFEIFKLGGSTNSLQELAGMFIPPLGYETFFGSGVVRTVFGARHDSGYVQTYSALGLPMAALFYGMILVYVMRLRVAIPERTGREVWLFAWLIPLMFLLEVKEPFITQAVTFYTAASLLACATPGREGRTA